MQLLVLMTIIANLTVPAQTTSTVKSTAAFNCYPPCHPVSAGFLHALQPLPCLPVCSLQSRATGAMAKLSACARVRTSVISSRISREDHAHWTNLPHTVGSWMEFPQQIDYNHSTFWDCSVIPPNSIEVAYCPFLFSVFGFCWYSNQT